MLCAAEAASARGRRLWDRAEALRGAVLAARRREEDEVVAQLTHDRQLVLRAFTLLLRRVRATSLASVDPAHTFVHFTAGSIPSSGNQTGAEGIAALELLELRRTSSYVKVKARELGELSCPSRLKGFHSVLIGGGAAFPLAADFTGASFFARCFSASMCAFCRMV